MDNKFTESYVSTINNFRAQTIYLNGETIDLEIWDNCGRQKTNCYYQEVNGIIFVYDVNSWNSFRNLRHWLKETKRFKSNEIKRLIVGNKCDNIENKCVDYISALEFSKNTGK